MQYHTVTEEHFIKRAACVTVSYTVDTGGIDKMGETRSCLSLLLFSGIKEEHRKSADF